MSTSIKDVVRRAGVSSATVSRVLSNKPYVSEHARQRILAAMEQATREGRGAVALDGKLLDIASIRQAEVLVKKAEAIGAG